MMMVCTEKMKALSGSPTVIPIFNCACASFYKPVRVDIVLQLQLLMFFANIMCGARFQVTLTPSSAASSTVYRQSEGGISYGRSVPLFTALHRTTFCSSTASKSLQQTLESSIFSCSGMNIEIIAG